MLIAVMCMTGHSTKCACCCGLMRALGCSLTLWCPAQCY